MLGDEQGGGRPEQFDREELGCDNYFRFPMVKLLDYRERQAELEASENPFALVVLAHLAAQDTRHDALRRRVRKDALRRRVRKWALTRRLYKRGYTREEMLRLYRFIDWLLELPGNLAIEFWRDMRTYEEEQTVVFVTYAERVGREEGQRRAILRVLTRRFGSVPPDVATALATVADPDRLDTLLDAALVAQDMPAFAAEVLA